MPEINGAVVVARALKSMGVDTVFFLWGGPMDQIYTECRRLGIKLVDTRHEQGAAMMAHAYSRVTGKVGVCIVSSGVGVVNTATGLAVANDDCAPLLVIGGSSTISSQGLGSFQEMDQVGMMKPITKCSSQIPTIERVADFIQTAFRCALSGRPGPVYLDIPADIIFGNIEENSVKWPELSLAGRPAGDSGLVAQALEMLEKAERPLVIAGSGALWSGASAELQEFIGLVQIPFFTTPLSRGLIPEDHPLCFPGARSFAWKNADVILVVGTRANWIVQYLSAPRFAKDVKVIMINIDAEEIGHNRHIDVGITGDARAVLGQFIKQTSGQYIFSSVSKKAWIDELKKMNSGRVEKVAALLNSDEKPIHPQRLCKEIRDFLPKDAIIAIDGNEILSFARQSIPTYYPGHRLNGGPSGCVGVAVPFGIGAKVAKPDKPVLVLSGDGSFGMNGMEMDSAIRNKINVVVVVSNNGGWAGMPTDAPCGRDLGFTRYDKIVEVLGGNGYYVDEAKDLRPALESAFASGKPSLINVITAPAKAVTLRFAASADEFFKEA